RRGEGHRRARKGSIFQSLEVQPGSTFSWEPICVLSCAADHRKLPLPWSPKCARQPARTVCAVSAPEFEGDRLFDGDAIPSWYRAFSARPDLVGARPYLGGNRLAKRKDGVNEPSGSQKGESVQPPGPGEIWLLVDRLFDRDDGLIDATHPQ